MNEAANYVPIVISGPSGAGKSSVIKRVKADMPGLAFAVSATDRLPRPAETEGEDYFFVSPKKFDDLIRQGAFIEYIVLEHRYGTLFSELDKHHHVILDVDVNGAMAIREHYPNAVLIFLAPPSLTVLEARLRKRSRMDGMAEEEIRERLVRAKREMELSQAYDHFVVNSDLEQTIAEVEAIIMEVVN